MSQEERRAPRSADRLGSGKLEHRGIRSETGIYYAVSTTAPVVFALVKAGPTQSHHGLL